MMVCPPSLSIHPCVVYISWSGQVAYPSTVGGGVIAVVVPVLLVGLMLPLLPIHPCGV